jgi:hypothetical protein
MAERGDAKPIDTAGVLPLMRWLFALGLLASACESRASAEDKMQPPVPVVVELFTSEGCSSCPPADSVLARLEEKQPVPGALVIPLAHHVDYWDSLGWPDPFASSAATKRQHSYRGNYTPQAVVDGSAEMVGSRGSALESAIAEAAKRPHVKVVITPGSAAGEVNVSAPNVEGTEIVVALVQARARIAVPRGENGGKTLDHTAIVRETKIGSHATFALPKGLGANDVRIVAFLQEQKSRRILGAAQAIFPVRSAP